jgi:hypothetical protein
MLLDPRVRSGQRLLCRVDGRHNQLVLPRLVHRRYPSSPLFLRPHLVSSLFLSEHILYFLSDRNFASATPNPFGLTAPGPYFDRQTVVLAAALSEQAVFPFAPSPFMCVAATVAVCGRSVDRDGSAVVMARVQ